MKFLHELYIMTINVEKKVHHHTDVWIQATQHNYILMVVCLAHISGKVVPVDNRVLGKLQLVHN
jgi:hypothetical protein